jgi:hypothetical protein
LSGGEAGTDIAVHANTVVLGAPKDDYRGTDAGAAYVFVRAGSGWSQEAKLLASDGTNNDEFGTAVAVHGDTVLVSAPLDDHSGIVSAGSVYVFVRSAGVWSEATKLIANPEDLVVQFEFGNALALCGDTAVVGIARHNGAAGLLTGKSYVFRGAGAVWSVEAVLSASDQAQLDAFGTSVDIDSDRILIGASGSPGAAATAGAAYVFDRSGSTWTETSKLTAGDGEVGDRFGNSVSVSADTALVGAFVDSYGSFPSAGSAYVFNGAGTSWTQGAKLKSSAPAIGDFFGYAVALEGERALVGTPFDDPAAGANAGSVTRFERTGTSWNEMDVLTAADGAAGDLFGYSVERVGSRVVAGAPRETPGLELGTVAGLAFDPASGTLFGLESGVLDRLVVVERFPGGHVVGDVGFANPQGLACDPDTGTLFATDIATDQLFTLDPLTGAGTAVGALGFPQVRGLAFDPGADTLYGTDVVTDELLTIDRVTGAGTAVGPLGFAGVQGLAFDTSTGTLFGTDTSTNQLLVIDTSTGAATAVGPHVNQYTVRGLGFDTAADILFGTSDGALYAGQDQLVDLDRSSGVTTSFGPYSVGWGGVAYVIEESPATSYCTAGTSAGGCRALLSATGAPSASAASGFDLSAAGVEGQKDGLFFFGTSGRQANPWGNGSSFQCVVPPVSRTGLLPGTGTSGACDGTFARDLNALWCPACPQPAKNPGAGTTVQAQLWYRDPLNTSNRTTSLSDGAEFVLGP